MYRISEINQSWKNLLGWRQNHDTSDFVIADSLTTSLYGQYFQDKHPLLTLANCKAIAPNFSVITYQTWSPTVQFRYGDRATSNGKNYRAKVANINKLPETNPTEWERFDPFSEWLQTKTNASIGKAVQRFWSEKLAAKSAKSILETRPVFDGAGRLSDVVTNTSEVVGMEIVPIRANGVTLRIDKIGLQFTGQGKHILYLMHSSRQEPLQVIELTRTRDTGMEWFEVLDLTLPYLSDDNDAGGSWYLVYDQTELPTGMQAINRNIDWSSAPCSSCNASTYSGWQIWSQYVEFHPFKVSGVERMNDGDFNGDFNSDFYTAPIKKWDVADQIHTYSNNYGINLQITLECDITDLLIQHREKFQNVVGLQVASDFLREFAYNPEFRLNRTQQNFSKAEILYELDGDSQGYKKSGINWELTKAYEAVDVDTNAMSRVCFPCNNRGLKYRTV